MKTSCLTLRRLDQRIDTLTDCVGNTIFKVGKEIFTVSFQGLSCSPPCSFGSYSNRFVAVPQHGQAMADPL